MIQLLQKASVLKTIFTTKKLVKSTQKVHHKKSLNEIVGIDLFDAAKLHTIAFTSKFFFDYIETVKDEGARNALYRCGLLYIIDNLQREAALYVSLGCVDG